MTIQVQTVKTIVGGNGAQTTWSYSFPIPAGANYELIYTDSSGNETSIALSNFSVSGIGSETGGTFTYNPGSGPIAAGTTLTFIREVPYQQLTNFTNQAAYNPEVLEAALDWIVMQTQQIEEQISRALIVPVVENSVSPLPNAAARANRLLGFDQNGVPVVVSGASGTPPNSQDLYVLLTGTPSGSQLMLQAVFNRAVVFPAGLAGSHAIAGTAPTAAAVVNLLYNGAQVGTINFAIGATTGTFTLTGGLTTAAAGVLKAVFQSSSDATLKDVSFTLSGSSSS